MTIQPEPICIQYIIIYNICIRTHVRVQQRFMWEKIIGVGPKDFSRGFFSSKERTIEDWDVVGDVKLYGKGRVRSQG